MRLITISREYGAGCREVAAQLSRTLGWDLLDHELLHRAAQLEHLADADLEALDEQALNLTDRFRLHPTHQRYIHGLTGAARQAAAQGNVILVGRGSRHLVGEVPEAFHLRLVAPRDWRVRRVSAVEGLLPEPAAARCLQMDRMRERFARYFFGPTVSQPWQYDLVVNTGRVPLDHVVALVVAVARGDGAPSPVAEATGGRVLTLARELGAGDTGFAPTLADRLGLRCYDRALLEQEAARLGVLESEAEGIDEGPAGIFERFRPGGIHRRYFEVLGQLMNELAAHGEVLLAGRGGSCFLRDHPHAFHVRLVAPMPIRVRRVMEYRWLAEALARKLIAETDDRRRRFYQDYFRTDWSDPLGYDLTVNSGRLGPAAVDLVALGARRAWRGADRA
jgi:cytidylate kinase